MKASASDYGVEAVYHMERKEFDKAARFFDIAAQKATHTVNKVEYRKCALRCHRKAGIKRITEAPEDA